MKQVNFKELNVETEIDNFQTIDLRKEIGNKVHQQAVTIPMDELARTIFHSEGPVCIEDEDYGMMMSVISNSFSLIVRQAVERCTSQPKEICNTPNVPEYNYLRAEQLDEHKNKEE